MATDDALGVGHRLSAGPAPELAETAFQHELLGARFLLRGLSFADLAHVIALTTAGVVPKEIAVRILRTLHAHHPELPDLVLSSDVGDLYNNRDRRIREMLGDESGWIHVGRARREATTIAWKMETRNRVSELHESIRELLVVILELSRQHLTTVMPDFTYLQHAHPTTLAHYLLTTGSALERDVVRCERAFRTVNMSPAGAGSVNGSRVPIDRRLLATLLGFDDVMVHTRDAMWAHDVALEAMHLAVSVLTTVDRLVEDLFVWNTEEFGFVEFDDAHVRTSVVMPQKKNPYALAFIRGEARHVMGLWVGVAATGMTASGQPDNRIYAYEDVPATLERAAGVVRLFRSVLRDATFNTVSMRNASMTGFTYATDMCDVLTLRVGLDNRTAHNILGRAVRGALDEGRFSLTSADVRRELSSLGVVLPESVCRELDLCLEADVLIGVRTGEGGAAPSSVDAMIASLTTRNGERARLFDQDKYSAEFDGRVSEVLSEWSADVE